VFVYVCRATRLIKFPRLLYKTRRGPVLGFAASSVIRARSALLAPPCAHQASEKSLLCLAVCVCSEYTVRDLTMCTRAALLFTLARSHAAACVWVRIEHQQFLDRAGALLEADSGGNSAPDDSAKVTLFVNKTTS
jgi:hypothetical protein